MKRFLKPWRHGEKGFTLIELLVVIALLGLLAAIAVPYVIQFIGRGEQEAKDTEEHNVQTAVLALFADAGVHLLGQNYYDIQDEADVEGVTAGTAPNNHSLDEYLMGGDLMQSGELMQSYDISIEGLVTVHSE